MMTPAHALDHAVALGGGIAAVLLGASLIGRVLKLAAGGRAASAVVDNLNARVRSWWWIAALVGLALAAGRTGVTLLFALVSAGALREFVHALTVPRAPVLALASYGIVLPLQYAALWSGWLDPALAVVPACALALLLAGAASPARHASSPGIAFGAGTLVCVHALAHVPALTSLSIPGYPERNAFLVLYLLLVVQGSDVLQYVWGRLLGRRHLAPRISPAKTVEGALGGIASATLLGWVLAPITPFAAWQSAAIALLLAGLGLCGGLMLSAVKRACGIKDWGTLIPGHGGMLDRVDSLCLSAPAFFWLVRLGWS